VLLAGLWAATAAGASPGFIAALFFVPDVAMLGYLSGPRVGAHAYNAAHSTLAPALLAATAFARGWDATALAIAAIWVGHIGFDRMAGYGLKYVHAFGDTHLGPIGWPRPS
jgi:hypothetical protein